MNDESPPTPNDLIKASKAEMEYYRVLRMTLHGLDSVRLKASASGLTISTALLGVAFTSLKYVENTQILGYNLEIKYLLAAACSFLSLVVGVAFYFKIRMFGKFIAKSIKIATEFENKIVDDENKGIRITHQFETAAHAGEKGDRIFTYTNYGISCCAAIFTVFYLSKFVLSIP